VTGFVIEPLLKFTRPGADSCRFGVRWPPVGGSAEGRGTRTAPAV